MLHGRSRETAAIERLLAQARAGHSGVLVIRGRPGSGKSALLAHAAHAARAAGGARRLSATGAEAEAGLPFAAAHLLLRPALGHLSALPDVQAEAIKGAFGQARSPRRDRFLIGLAGLSLLAEYAASGPLLCLVDDAHWLDHASADMLQFMARRLDREGIALICAARDGDPALAGLPDLTLGPLSDTDATGLLDERLGPLLAQVAAAAPETRLELRS
ncbi:AAA family ATPase [Nonomuraea zeae]|uniref:ATP-binding protein n=1 Tax=Nonomuraea zeae TaxID=1642303 RepID=A0A5S4GQ80_9ACTN|nr:ATP-binding protein [Nonomuraea zeae]TMR35027.1 ATP-binding protein [Nonomuraea zeae]